MYKLFTKNNFIKKVFIIIIAVLLMTFGVPTYSKADVGGVLLGPIFDLLSSIGDVVLAGLNAFFVDGEFTPAGGDIFDITMVDHNQSPFTDGQVGQNTDRPELDEAVFNTTETDDQQYAEVKYYGIDKLNGIAGNGDVKVPFTRYSPEKIFSGQVPAFDINFISPDDFSGDTAMQSKSIAYQLRDTVAKWYVALRNLATVGMMVVLLYVGIRIIISSTASDKAKYKEFLKDWVIALCLLFTLHYIMSFTCIVVDSITDAVVGDNKNTNTIPVVVVNSESDIGADGTSSATPVFSFNTDLMGYARFLVQSDDIGDKILYFLIFVAMVIYTVMFTITYLKRSLTMAFLTIIAPLIALTYPIDKISDGSAQGFNAWLKEYIYNALIQPFHLIIYTVFAGAAVVDLSADNPIYAILVLGFIIQSEKLLRKFFGFEKASSAGSLGSFAGGAATMGLAQRLIGKASSKVTSKSSSSTKIRTSNNGTTVEDNNAPGLGDFANPLLAGGTPPGGGGGGTPPGGGGGGTPPGGGGGGTPPGGGGGGTPPGGGGGGTPSTPTSAGRRTYWTQNDTRGAGQYIRDSWRNSTRLRPRIENGVIGQTARGIRSRVERPVRFVGRNVNRVRNAATNGIRRIPKPIRNTARGAGAVLADLGKRGARTAGRVTLAGAGATIGAAAGIVSGDIDNVLQYGATGAGIGAAGFSALEGLGSSAISGASQFASDVRTTYNTQAYGQNVAQVAEQTRNFIKDKEMMQYLDENIPTEDGHKRTRAEQRAMMQKAAEYYNAGITEQKKLAKAMKLEGSIAEEIAGVQGMSEQEKAETATKRAMIAAQFAERVDDKKLVNKNYVEDVVSSWTKGMTDPSRGINEAQARKEAEKMMQYVKKLKKVN